MAVLLQVLVLGVIAAAADDGHIRWSPSRATLSCAVEDAGRALRPPPPPLEADDRPAFKPYVWRHNGQIVKSNRVSSNGTLEVRKREEGSEGEYQCGLKRNGGLVLGHPVHVKFAYMNKFTVHPQNATAWVGQPFVLFCNITSGPAASISWLRDDEQLPADYRYHLINNQLLILDVQEDDAGMYKCKATNPSLNKTRYSHAGWLQVAGSEPREPSTLPLLTEDSIYASKGTRVVIPCPVMGWPRPKLTWEYAPAGGGPSVLQDVSREVLVLHNLQENVEGMYTCYLDNIKQRSFKVVMTEPVVITVPPTSKNILRAGTVRFNCTAVGRPPPVVTWYKDGEPIKLAGRFNLRNSTDGKRVELVISGLESSDAGVYQCFARNVASTATAWASLNVTGLAEAAAPTGVQCQPTGARTVLVRWAPPPGDQTVIAYSVQTTSADVSRPGQPHTKSEEEITLAIPLAEYEFQVRAVLWVSINLGVNKSAASDMSKSVTCQGQGVPIKMARLDDDSVVVSWRQFAEQNKGVVEWMLQYRAENTSQVHNVTLDGSEYEYTLKVPPSKSLDVRVLGSRRAQWLHQNLTLVQWVPTSTAGQDLLSDEITAVPRITGVTEGARDITIEWSCCENAEQIIEPYFVRVCWSKRGEEKKCEDTSESRMTLSGLQPNTEYEVQLQARLSAGAGPVYARYVTTRSEGINATYAYVNSSAVVVRWRGAGGRYSVHHSAHLVLPMTEWPTVHTVDNSAIVPIDPTKTTYMMVFSKDPERYSAVLTVPPQNFVPIKMAKLDDDSVVVSWRHFAEQNDGVKQWLLQYRAENTDQVHNITLDGKDYEYTLKASPSKPLEVRVLGSRNAQWLHQNLTLVPWVSTTTAGQDLASGEITAVPRITKVTEGVRDITIEWSCCENVEQNMGRYFVRVCWSKRGEDEKCEDTSESKKVVTGLQPHTAYVVQLQARSSAGVGPLTLPYNVTTRPEGREQINATYKYVNSSTVLVKWQSSGGRYTVHHSAHLVLPMERWAAVHTAHNSAIVPIDPTKTTYIMVFSADRERHSGMLTVPPQDLEVLNLEYKYTSAGLELSWTGGLKTVRYTQNLTHPLEQWRTIDVTQSSVLLTGVDRSLPTFVMLAAPGSTQNSPLTIPPAPVDNSYLYLAVGIACGVVFLLLLAAASVCIWRRRKRARSPVRTRRRTANEGAEEEGSEMKSVGGRLANGGGSKDAGEPLLNGHVHITENPTQSKAPNGRMRKGYLYEAAFDLSRYEDPDATQETVLDADTSTSKTYNFLDTSRRPEYDVSRSSRDVSANNSFNKLPDDNMNSELTRSTDFGLDNSKIQPTLQPNG